MSTAWQAVETLWNQSVAGSHIAFQITQRRLTMNTIVIKVWRGMVSEVYASDPDTQVIVSDDDCETQRDEPVTETTLPEHRVY
jgi:hypothetical protein